LLKQKLLLDKVAINLIEKETIEREDYEKLIGAKSSKIKKA